MDVAEAMLTVAELEVGAPVIMHSNALVMRQDVSGSHADLPAFVMHVVVGQFFCAGHVQPPQPLCDAHAAFIEMDDRRSNQLLANLGKTVLCVPGKLARGGEYRRLRRRIPVEGSQQLSDASERDELLAVEIAGERLQTQTILGRLTHVGGKRSLYARTTARTLLDFRLMLCHFDSGWWNVEYLPFLMPLDSLRIQLCLAVRAIR